LGNHRQRDDGLRFAAAAADLGDRHGGQHKRTGHEAHVLKGEHQKLEGRRSVKQTIEQGLGVS